MRSLGLAPCPLPPVPCTFPAVETLNLVLDETSADWNGEPMTVELCRLETIHISCVVHGVISAAAISRLFLYLHSGRVLTLRIHGLCLVGDPEELYDIAETVVRDCTCDEGPGWNYPTL